MVSTKLAIHGGTPVRGENNPLPQLFPRTVGPNAYKYYQQLIESGNAANFGFDRAFAQLMGSKHAAAMANCTVAVHASLAAAGVGPEDEVVVSPVTDYGTIYGILAQRAIPVFADADPWSGNVTPQTVAQAITPRTRAILVVHWAGIMCDMDGIIEVAKARGIPVIEDVCQAPLARYKGKNAGTIGDMGCFSFDNEKHISCGSGGAIVTDNDEYHARYLNFAESRGAYIDDPSFGRRHKVLGCNYRFDVVRQPMALAQIEVLPELVERRRRLGALLSQKLDQIEGIHSSPVPPDGEAVYWIYPIMIETEMFESSIDEMAAAMAAEGLAGVGPARYYLIPDSLDVLNDLRHTYQNGAQPGGRSDRYLPHHYSAEMTPNAKWYVDHMVRFSFTEKYTEKDIDDIAQIVAKVAEHFSKGRGRVVS